ncbi:MAG: 2-dehydropantoate 2-reductase [Clostridia bacterium]|nr:2-dehydropantoate 2-reductase [Clostridia bacterium]
MTKNNVAIMSNDGELDVRNARVAVYGAGAMGTVLGVLLKKGGLNNVDLITRNQEHVKGMKERGATLVCEGNGIEITEKVDALLPSEMTGKYDVIFLMTKQRMNGETLEFLLPYLKEDTVVCTTQNGLPEPSVAEIVGNERTYGAVASFGATFIGGGKVALTSKISAMRMEVGGYCNDGRKTEFLVKILSHVGKATGNEEFVKPSENLMEARWSKLALNSAFSGLSVVTGLTFGEISKRSKSRKIALGILRECMDVANATGVKLAPMKGYDMEKLLGGKSFFKRLFSYTVLPFAMKSHKKLVSGMLKDVEKGRKCEIDFIDGVVCREGDKVGVETPLCDTVVEIVHGIENGTYETDYRNVDFFGCKD